jgi:uncharacterized membrane protein SpoIIM required for sporulation
MNLDRFEEEREPGWRELERLVEAAGRRPERLGPDGVRRLGALYRAAAADLAFVRRRFRGDPVEARLELLVSRARHLVYDAPSRRVFALRFFTRDYWRLVAERPRPLLLAALLLAGPALLGGTWASTDPGAAGGLVPDEMAAVTEPRPEGADLGLGVEERAAFASAIFTNNIQVSFLAFAGGIALGLATAVVLLFNGVLLGTVAGLAADAGNARVFAELVVPHGVLELSCIVVAGAAGLRLGWAIVEPGRRRRVDSLVAEGRSTVAIVLGTAPWLVVAGLVEGFLTPTGAGLVVALVVGFGLAALFWALVLALGRARGGVAAKAEPVPSLAGTR